MSVLMLRLLAQMTDSGAIESPLADIISSNVTGDLPTFLYESMAVFRRKFLAYLEHTLDDRKQLKFFQSIYQQIPQQAIIALVKLRTLPDGSLVRALLETILTKSTLSNRSIFQNMCSSQLGIEQVQLWISEAMGSLIPDVRRIMSRRLSECR